MRKTALIFAALISIAFSSSLWAFEPDVSDELELDVAKAFFNIQ